MTSAKDFDTNAPVVDGVKIELYEPNLVVLPIPENHPGRITYLELAIWITNNRLSPFIFNPSQRLSPQLISPDGQILKRQESKGKWFKTELDGLRIPPKDYRVFHLLARLCWRNRSLQLQFFIFPPQLKQFWTFGELKPDNYQLRLVERDTNKVPMNESRLATQFVNLRLVQPVESQRQAVEVDGLLFETLVSESVVSIPADRPDDLKSIKLGIRVTNNGVVPHRLLFFYIMPELLDENGEQIRRDSGSNATYFPRVCDCIWIEPGDNFSFFREGKLSGNGTNLRVSGREKSGGFWSFPHLKPNTYQFRFAYQNKNNRVLLSYAEYDEQIVEDVWTGKVYTPYVNIRVIDARTKT